MKKIIVIALALVMAFSMTACFGFMNKGGSSGGEKPPKKFKQLEVVNQEYCVTERYGGTDYDVKYIMKLKNDNKDVVLYSAKVKATARDSAGNVLGTDDTTVPVIYPGKEGVVAATIMDLPEKPAEVTIEAEDVTEDYGVANSSQLEHEEYIPLEAEGVNVRDKKMTGDIVNKNDYSIDYANIYVLFRDKDGKLVDIETSSVSNVPAEGKTAFETYLFDIDYDSYQISIVYSARAK